VSSTEAEVIAVPLPLWLREMVPLPVLVGRSAWAC
jgi:hypothetical protein